MGRACAWPAWPKPDTPLWPLANILIVLGALYAAFNLHRLASAASASPAASVTGLVDFQRAELALQHHALVTAWRWYLLPFAPGLVLWIVALCVGAPLGGQSTMAATIIAASIVIAVYAVIILFNLLGAARLQRVIEDLGRNSEKSE